MGLGRVWGRVECDGLGREPDSRNSLSRWTAHHRAHHLAWAPASDLNRLPSEMRQGEVFG